MLNLLPFSHSVLAQGINNFFSLAFTLFERRCSYFCQVVGKICRIHAAAEERESQTARDRQRERERER